MCRLPEQRPQPKQNGQMRQAHHQQRQRITRTRRRPQAAVQRNQSAGSQQSRQIQCIRRRCNGAREKLHERGKGKSHERRRHQMHIITAGRLRINPTSVRHTQNWQRARHLPQENACHHIGKRAEKKDFFSCAGCFISSAPASRHSRRTAAPSAARLLPESPFSNQDGHPNKRRYSRTPAPTARRR